MQRKEQRETSRPCYRSYTRAMTSKISDYILLTITITSLTSPRGCPDFSLHHPKRFTITMFHYTPSPTSHAHLPLLSDLLQHVSTNLPDLSPPVLAVPHLLLQPHVDSPSLAKLCLQLPVLRLHRHKLRNTPPPAPSSSSSSPQAPPPPRATPVPSLSSHQRVFHVRYLISATSLTAN
jgi:hypothetical protein